jgi:hypothetical protein
MQPAVIVVEGVPPGTQVVYAAPGGMPPPGMVMMAPGGMPPGAVVMMAPGTVASMNPAMVAGAPHGHHHHHGHGGMAAPAPAPAPTPAPAEPPASEGKPAGNPNGLIARLKVLSDTPKFIILSSLVSIGLSIWSIVSVVVAYNGAGVQRARAHSENAPALRTAGPMRALRGRAGLSPRVFAAWHARLARADRPWRECAVSAPTVRARARPQRPARILLLPQPCWTARRTWWASWTSGRRRP